PLSLPNPYTALQSLLVASSVVFVLACCSVRQSLLPPWQQGRCSGWRQLCRWVRLVGFPGLQVIEDLLDDHGIFDAGNVLHWPFALLAFADVYVEHPLEAPCPRHGGALLHRRAVIRLGGLSVHSSSCAL